MTTRERLLRFFKAGWPWLVGTAITVVIALRVPLDAFRTAINEGPHVTLFAVDFLITIGLLLTDSVATWIGLIAARVRLQPFTVFAVRGATYVLPLLNYVSGQGWLGFYLTRVGVPTASAVGATLFLTGTTFATLLLLTTATWAIADDPSANRTMWWVLVGGCTGFAVYLVV